MDRLLGMKKECRRFRGPASGRMSEPEVVAMLSLSRALYVQAVVMAVVTSDMAAA